MRGNFSLFKKDVPVAFWGQWVALALAAALVLGHVVYGSLNERREIEETESRRLLGLARLIDYNLSRQLSAAALAIETVLRDLPRWRTADGYSEGASLRLKSIVVGNPGVRAMQILDAQGISLSASHDELVGKSFADKAWFQDMLRPDDETVLHLSPPFTTVLGVYGMNLSREFRADGGTVRGVISATLDDEFFRTLLESVNYAPDMWTALGHGGGVQFMLVPDRPGQSGRNINVPGSFFSRHMESGQKESLLQGIVYATGEYRMMAQRTILPDWPRIDQPLVVATGRNIDAVFGEWRIATRIKIFLSASAVLAAAIALLYYQTHSLNMRRQRMLLESERRQWAERMDLALKGADLGLWDWHIPSGKVVFSARWYKMLGYTPEDVTPSILGMRRLIHPDDWRDIRRALKPHLRGLAPQYQSIHRFRHKSGDWVWILDRGQVVEHDDTGAPERMVGTYLDITDMHNAEEEIRRSNAELQQFAYAVSHDLQEPLRMVASYTTLLGRRYQGKLDSDADEFIHFAVDGAKRMQQMIEGLLEYSRVQTHKAPLAKVSLETCLDDALANLALSIEEAGAEIIRTPMPDVMGDAGQLMRAFQNVIGNAVKYRADERKPIIRIACDRDGAFWKIAVADNGIGMPEGSAARAFDVFQRLHDRTKYPGAGIGLAIARRIVERHGGHIWATSQPDHGSTFYFTLPV